MVARLRKRHETITHLDFDLPSVAFETNAVTLEKTFDEEAARMVLAEKFMFLMINNFTIRFDGAIVTAFGANDNWQRHEIENIVLLNIIRHGYHLLA